MIKKIIEKMLKPVKAFFTQGNKLHIVKLNDGQLFTTSHRKKNFNQKLSELWNKNENICEGRKKSLALTRNENRNHVKARAIQTSFMSFLAKKYFNYSYQRTSCRMYTHSVTEYYYRHLFRWRNVGIFMVFLGTI